MLHGRKADAKAQNNRIMNKWVEENPKLVREGKVSTSKIGYV